MDAKDRARCYWAWKHALYEWKYEGRLAKDRLIAVADAMTLDTDYGQRCFKGTAVIGEMLGLHRLTVGRYRAELCKYGWLLDTGQRKGRAKVLAISIDGMPIAPEVTPAVTVPQVPNVPQVPVCFVCGKDRSIKVTHAGLQSWWCGEEGHATYHAQ